MPAEGLLGEHLATIDRDLEHAAGRRGEGDLAVGKFLTQLRRQPGGAGLVVSDDAVFDGDVHGVGSGGWGIGNGE